LERAAEIVHQFAAAADIWGQEPKKVYTLREPEMCPIKGSRIEGTVYSP
jgi:hypothetical protein